ncbi:MAG: nucleotidyl transferase AbiEii/AbiGii toxin family protein [Candidatus Omnitrophica bacterium]|nr:nucleotidyl transferase AbiEii/AbiGii toxin family protein [Candidatus Omnitrophota bacterium]
MAKRILNFDQLEALRKETGFKDPGIFEKSVYAFNLLSDILKAYPDLVFKGGTSMLLHIYPPVRLSIDIDILLPLKEKEGLSKKLELVSQNSEWFEGIEENKRIGKKIPKAHFKFAFTSHFSKVPQYILLDVVFTDSPYDKLVRKDIKDNPMAFSGAKGIVKIPSVEGLFGDKLTAISPKTVGISLEDRNMEFVKQVIDLGELFNVIEDTKELNSAFRKTLFVENGFRGEHYAPDDVFDDIMDVAFKYSQSLLKGGDNSFEEINLINEGNTRVVNHLRERLRPEDIKIAFSRIVYTISLLRGTNEGSLIKKVDMDIVKNYVFPEKFRNLERLKKFVPEAYFYWTMGVGKKEK